MRRWTTLALSALALAGAASPLSAAPVERVVRSSAGELAGELRFRFDARTQFADRLRLRLTRAGAVVRSGVLTVPGTAPGLAREPPVTTFLGPPVLRIVDLDGDGVREALIDVAQAGASCCARSVVVALTANGLVERARFWGGFTRAPALIPDPAGGRVFVGRDPRFESRYTARVISFEPIQVLRFPAGRFQVATRDFPQLVQRDLRELRRLRPMIVRDGFTDLRGLMPAIAGNLLLLGRRAEADRELARALAAGQLVGPGNVVPGGRAFLRLLRADLRRFGYIR